MPPNTLPAKSRVYVRWSEEEENSLRVGVSKYGEGKWKRILADPVLRKALNGRTNVDLKDKWRTMVCGDGSRSRGALKLKREEKQGGKGLQSASSDVDRKKLSKGGEGKIGTKGKESGTKCGTGAKEDLTGIGQQIEIVAGGLGGKRKALDIQDVPTPSDSAGTAPRGGECQQVEDNSGDANKAEEALPVVKRQKFEAPGRATMAPQRRLPPDGELWELWKALNACQSATPFRRPVPYAGNEDYDDVVLQRMDLVTIRRRLESETGSQGYTALAFRRDILLMATNALVYSIEGSSAHQAALRFKREAWKLLKDPPVEDEGVKATVGCVEALARVSVTQEPSEAVAEESTTVAEGSPGKEDFDMKQDTAGSTPPFFFPGALRRPRSQRTWHLQPEAAAMQVAPEAAPLSAGVMEEQALPQDEDPSASPQVPAVPALAVTDVESERAEEAAVVSSSSSEDEVAGVLINIRSMAERLHPVIEEGVSSRGGGGGGGDAHAGIAERFEDLDHVAGEDVRQVKHSESKCDTGMNEARQSTALEGKEVGMRSLRSSSSGRKWQELRPEEEETRRVEGSSSSVVCAVAGRKRGGRAEVSVSGTTAPSSKRRLQGLLDEDGRVEVQPRKAAGIPVIMLPPAKRFCKAPLISAAETKVNGGTAELLRKQQEVVAQDCSLTNTPAQSGEKLLSDLVPSSAGDSGGSVDLKTGGGLDDVEGGEEGRKEAVGRTASYIKPVGFKEKAIKGPKHKWQRQWELHCAAKSREEEKSTALLTDDLA